jgi:hypothetical protein
MVALVHQTMLLLQETRLLVHALKFPLMLLMVALVHRTLLLLQETRLLVPVLKQLRVLKVALVLLLKSKFPLLGGSLLLVVVEVK